jgi:quinol monooxygenase YgiN
MNDSKASFVVNSTYTIHPDDIQIFADAVLPHIKKTQAIPGCLFYTFSFDLVDKNLCHLAEGWTDREVIDRHLRSAVFQEAYKKVLDNVRVLDYKGTMYSVSGEEPIKPAIS